MLILDRFMPDIIKMYYTFIRALFIISNFFDFIIPIFYIKVYNV